MPHLQNKMKVTQLVQQLSTYYHVIGVIDNGLRGQ